MIDWLGLPPLAALRAFSAYAETGSLTEAGARLNVTHAAISQQIRGLEERLGVKLIERNGPQTALSSQGQRLALALEQGFETISGAVMELTGGRCRAARAGFCDADICVVLADAAAGRSAGASS